MYIFFFFFPLSFLFVGFPTFFCPIRQLEPKFGHETLLLSLYPVLCHFIHAHCYQLPLLCSCLLEVHLYSFPFQRSRLKSPTTWWALSQYSKVSIRKTTLHVLFLKICFLSSIIHPFTFFSPTKVYGKPFMLKVLCWTLGVQWLVKTVLVDVIIILVWLLRPETMMSSLAFFFFFF